MSTIEGRVKLGVSVSFLLCILLAKRKSQERRKKRAEKRQAIIRNTDVGGRKACKGASHDHPGAQKVG